MATQGKPSAENVDRMDVLWGDDEGDVSSGSGDEGIRLMPTLSQSDLTPSRQLFCLGRFAMFIHWGLYSTLGNQYANRTYYGISEWIMSPHLAGIPVEDYKTLATRFVPEEFDAKEIVNMAKMAGMKYIVMTAKHHDGFAMYHSKASDFNIVDATPWGRDPLREVADAAREADLGFGIYYSHNQDWIFPGGTGYRGPTAIVNPNTGKEYTFNDYFEEKCLPQVKELMQNYGNVNVIWFDTPGKMPQHLVEKLIATVRTYQPDALISGRVGYGLGDYSTLGDMEIPVQNPSQALWESVDTTNDSWGYAAYDNNFKSPKQILVRLLSCVARGGTYMINIGPKGDGSVPLPAAASLQSLGPWIETYGERVLYGEHLLPSPWKHGFPWGDAVLRQGTATTSAVMYLFVFDWPLNGKLHLFGLPDELVVSATLMTRKNTSQEGDTCHPHGQRTSREVVDNVVSVETKHKWTILHVGWPPPDSLVSVVALELSGSSEFLRVDETWGVDLDYATTVPMDFSTMVGNVKKSRHRWMEKFGEWKSTTRIHNWMSVNDRVHVDVNILYPGWYNASLNYSSKQQKRIIWQVELDDGVESISNEQGCSEHYGTHIIGWLRIGAIGRHKISISTLGHKFDEQTSLSSISFEFVKEIHGFNAKAATGLN